MRLNDWFGLGARARVSLRAPELRREERRECVRDQRLVRALPIDESCCENTHGTLSAFRVVEAGHRIHGVAQLSAGSDGVRHRGRKRHRQRSSSSHTSIGRNDDRPGAGSHAAIALLDDATLDADAEVRAESLSRRRGARARPADRLLISMRLIRHA